MKEFTKDDIIMIDEDGLEIHFGDIVYTVRKMGGQFIPDPITVPTLLYYRNKEDLRYLYFLNKESAEKRSKEIITEIMNRKGVSL